MEFEWDETKNRINQTIRIISSRKATASEKAGYERSIR